MDDVTRSWASGGSWNDDPPAAPPPPPPPPPKKRAPKAAPDFGPPLRRGRSGLVCGRFLPLHRGHELLIDFAASEVEKLSVIVFAAPDDPVPGELRVRWLRERFPAAHVPDAVPQLDAEPGSVNFAFAFAERIEATLGEKPQFYFSSEDTGMLAAMALGATHVPVDPARTLVPISGSAIREDVNGKFEFLAATVRPWFVRRVAIVGAESTGKSRLAKQLAADYAVPHVSEYLRTLAGDRRGIAATEIQLAARGQIAAEDALARDGGHVLFCDTDLRTVRLWSERLHGGHAPAWLAEEIARRPYDLTLLLAPDVPFVGARERDDPEARAAFHARLHDELEMPCAVISGDWEARLTAARKNVHDLLKTPRFFSARGARMLGG